MFKIGDKVKTSCEDTRFDCLIGTIISIDEGWEGRGTIKIQFDVLNDYNQITGKINKCYNQCIRFDPEDLKIIQ